MPEGLGALGREEGRAVDRLEDRRRLGASCPLAAAVQLADELVELWVVKRVAHDGSLRVALITGRAYG
jgi:hypothetical protein